MSLEGMAVSPWKDERRCGVFDIGNRQVGGTTFNMDWIS
jgi:hypothetical protein